MGAEPGPGVEGDVMADVRGDGGPNEINPARHQTPEATLFGNRPDAVMVTAMVRAFDNGRLDIYARGGLDATDCEWLVGSFTDFEVRTPSYLPAEDWTLVRVPPGAARP